MFLLPENCHRFSPTSGKRPIFAFLVGRLESGRSYGYDIRTRVAKNHSKTVSSSLPYVNYTKYATVQIFNDEIQ